MSSLINAQDGCLQMVAHRASMGRSQPEHLAQQVALRSTMPSTSNQIAYLRAQLALWDAQIEQVKAEGDNHFVQEEEVLAHMRLLSSEAKDWKSRVVTEAEEVLCRESAQMAQQATEAQEAMDQHYKAKWLQRPTLQLYVNPTAPKCSLLHPRCMRRMQNIKSFMMHKRDGFNSRHKPFEKLTNKNNKQSMSAHEYQQMIHERRHQADEQPEVQKLLWKQQLFQQASYKAEIHELHTELLNLREKSEMKSHLAANMCKIDQTVLSRTVESEPENVLNTLSPGRSTRWILPHELETPNRPTSSGLQSPIGAPVQLGPSPMTREYSAPPPGSIPPAQWGDVYGRAGDDGCELFGASTRR